MKRRTNRMGDLVRAELSDLLLREVQDPRIKLVSLTSVEVTPDMRRAIVRVSALGDEAQRLGALEALRHARGFLRTELSHRLNLYSVPQLHFAYDDSIESGMRLSKLIDEAVAGDHKPNS